MIQHLLVEGFVKRFVPILALLAWIPSLLLSVEIKKDGWKFPNPAKAEKVAIRPIDSTDRIPGKETLVKTYKKDEKVAFETFEIEGEVFACQFHFRETDDQSPTNYAIVDVDGDGVFETKYGPGEKARTPEWVITRYYQRHPELKDPGPSPTSPPPSGK